MLNRDAEKLGDLREAQFIRRPHAAFPRRPLLRGNAERFGAPLPAAASGELFQATGADVGGDDLPQAFRDFPHALNPSVTASPYRRSASADPASPICIASSGDADIMIRCDIPSREYQTGNMRYRPAKPLWLCRDGYVTAFHEEVRMALCFGDVIAAWRFVYLYHTELAHIVNA